MLFMVIEHFRDGDPDPVYRRFQKHGRMFPADGGLEFVGSWVDATGGRCFQVMVADSLIPLQEWMLNWRDIVDFEIVPIVQGVEFSAMIARRFAVQDAAPGPEVTS